MSFWDNVKKIAQPYTTEEYDGYDEYDGYEEEAPRNSSSSADTANHESTASTTSSTPKTGGFSGQVLNMNGGKQEVVLFRPTCFNDSTKAADDLRDKKSIIVNMENVDGALARRVVDFLSGCAYALDGNFTKIAQSAYLCSPHSVSVSGDLDAPVPESESYI